METLKNLNKLWRTTPLLQLQPIATTYSDVSDYRVYDKEVAVEDDAEEEEEEEEESFFELEVVMLNSKTRDAENGSFNNGRRVVPVEPDTKLKPHPDSPVSILKSTPKFKVSLFKNHINSNNNNNTDLKLKQRPKVDDSVKQKLSATTISTLIRESNCSNSPVSKQSMMSKCKTEDDVYNDNDDSVSNDDDSSSSSSKRFSKDVMHKYLKLKLIKPFHLKLAKRCASVNNNKSSKLFGVHKASSSSVSSSPVPSSSISSSSTSSSSSSSSGYGFRVVCKQLGKSRSASSMTVGIGGSGVRRDESLMMVEHDDGGIQSAILHCKRSFNSSRDSSDSNSSEESRS